MSSIIDPLCCGFAKIAILEISTTTGVNLKQKSVKEVSGEFEKQFKKFKELFPFEVHYEWYRRNVQRIKDSIQLLGKKSTPNKLKVLSCFSIDEWKKVVRKERHSLFNCEECLRSDKLRPSLSLFPINKKDMKGKKRAEEAGLFRPPIQVKVVEALDRLNEEFKSQNYTKSFEEAAFDLKRKLKRQEERVLLKKTKKNIESQWRETSVLRYQVINVQ